jgi:hypothetical protein
MSHVFRSLIGGVIVAIIATPTFSQSVQQIKAAVKACVEVVNENDDRPSNPNNWHFDAYYNPTTGKVVNNASTAAGASIQFQTSVLFAFEKCMAESGAPLK